MSGARGRLVSVGGGRLVSGGGGRLVSGGDGGGGRGVGCGEAVCMSWLVVVCW